MEHERESWGRSALLRRAGNLDLPNGPGSPDPVTAAELAPLPGTVQRYLQFMGVVGRPRDWSFRMESTGRFRMRPDGGWMECEAWQYDSSIEIARVFLMTARFGPLMRVTARDTYLHGRGRMIGKMAGLVTVADAAGDELDQGELVTWLNDAVLYSPSMLIGLPVAWAADDQEGFDVALTDLGRTVRARVTIDDRGAPTDFATTDRFRYDTDRAEARWVRERWTTPVGEWRMVNGRPVPTCGRAVWHTDQGPFTYAEFRARVDTIRYNVPARD